MMKALALSRFARWLLAGLLTILAATLLVWLVAPQVVILLREGFPVANWPARGTHVTVKGATAALSPLHGHAAPPAAVERLRTEGGSALLMDRGGSLQVEEYANGQTRDSLRNSYSLVKSLVGALTMRALADGRIMSLDDPMTRYLGDDAPDITIREALTMTSGLKLGSRPEKPMEDGSFSPWGGLAQLHAYGLSPILPKLRPDPLQRGQFRYESVNSALLGAVLERAYVEPLADILSRLIWRPAGAQDAYWRSYPADSAAVSAYCCLYARPLDWALVGRFLLNNGTPDQAFLPDQLWQTLFLPDLPPEARRQGSYGYQIRHDILDREGEKAQGPFAYFLGHHGQVVYLLPALDTVIVRFGDSPQLLHSTVYELFR